MALVNSFLLLILLEKWSSPERKSSNPPVVTISFVKAHLELHSIHPKFAEAVQVGICPFHPTLQSLPHRKIAGVPLGFLVWLRHPFKQLQVWDSHGPERDIGLIQFPAKTWAWIDDDHESDPLDILFAEGFLECSFCSFAQVDFEQVLAIKDVQAFVAHLF